MKSLISFKKAKPIDSGFVVLWDEDRDLGLKLHRFSFGQVRDMRKSSIRIANEAIKKAMEESK